MGDKLRHDRRGNADDSGDPTETGAHPRRTEASDPRPPTEARASTPRSPAEAWASAPRSPAEARASTRSISTIELRREPAARARRRAELDGRDGTQDDTQQVQRSGEQAVSGRASRPSIRPSAFGIPRAAPTRSTAPTPPRAPDKKRESVPPAASGRPASTRALGRASEETLRSPGHDTASSSKKRPSGLLPPPIVKTDIEELLPLSHGVKSLPRPPRMPGFEPQLLPLASARYFPWASLGVFMVMLVASFAPLSRYRGERRESTAIAAERSAQRVRSDANEPALLGMSGALAATLRAHAAAGAEAGTSTPLAPAVSVAGQVERALWGKPKNVREALVQEAERALHDDDAELAESLFARALEFDAAFEADDARPEFGLARVRAARDDIAGAEGWLLRAIHKRPRRIEYRALHAEILERGGRRTEAQMERAAARALAHFSGGTRPR